MPDLIPKRGHRVAIFGQTGSGKTAFAVWLLSRTPHGITIIFETKREPKFDYFLDENGVVVETVEAAIKAKQNPDIDYIVVRPPVEVLSEPSELDLMLLKAYHGLKQNTIYIDELTMYHSASQPGKGLIALLTRGRSEGITLIYSSQRPSGISMYALSEAQAFFLFKLQLPADRKRVDSFIVGFDKIARPVPHGFIYYDAESDKSYRYGPVTLDKKMQTGYVDLEVNATKGRGAEKPKLKYL